MRIPAGLIHLVFNCLSIPFWNCNRYTECLPWRRRVFGISDAALGRRLPHSSTHWSMGRVPRRSWKRPSDKRDYLRSTLQPADI